MEHKMSKRKSTRWYSKSISSEQGLVIEERTGRSVAVAYDKADAPLLAAAPKMLAALKEIADRGPVKGYNSASALRLRLVATQSIARTTINEIENP